MKPQICPICRQYCDGDYIKFADYKPLPENWVGHPGGYECFCKTHDHIARQFSHLPLAEAITAIKRSDAPPAFISPVSWFKGEPAVVFEQRKERAAVSATILLLFSFGMLFLHVIGFLLRLSRLKLLGSCLNFSDMLGFLAFLFFGMSGAALFGYFSYQSFKLARRRKPRLRLDSEGFSDLTLGDDRIFWRDITGMKLFQRRVRHTSMTIYSIRMSLNENSEFKRNSFILNRLLRKIFFAGYDLEIPISVLNVSESTAFNYFNEFYTKSGTPR